MATFEIEEVRRRIGDFLDRGKNDDELISLLHQGIHFCAIECELVDYKESAFGDAIALAKGIKHIVALHNTYGGYLILGVAEIAADQLFELKGFDSSRFDLKQIKDKIFSYTGSHINISVHNFDADGRSGLSLYVPKRAAGVKPVAFGKNGPTIEKKTPAFESGDVVFRSGDNTRIARGDEFEFLYGPRQNPYVDSKRLFNMFSEVANPLPHNLPDRNFICPKFVGRTDVLRRLWTWLSDQFSYAKVLAGEGGLGKTSIAYEFCEKICRVAPTNIERVIWVTAKKQQFSGDKNDFIGVPETHYTNYKELLIVLCRECAIREEEVDGSDESLLQSFLREAIAIVPTLFVVDDVDSLSLNDQKRVMELAWQFGSQGSRFLLTTRRNLSFSTDLTIELEGLAGQEFLDYVLTLRERYKGPELKESDIRSLRETTKGSPLFTESLYRLVRRGVHFYSAIKEWKGKSGNEARAAALKREIEALPEEARRVLFAASIFRNCSRTELEEATGYTGETISDALDELSSLFLVHAPLISEEPRFEVSSATQSVIQTIKTSLVPDHAKFEAHVRSLRRHDAEIKTQKNNQIVAAAINEALAFLRVSDVPSALKTVAAAQRKTRYHADLYVLQARCLISAIPKRASEARVAARKAYHGNNRKPLLFGVWYDAEMSLKHWVGAADVCDLALTNSIEPSADWRLKRAAANFQLGDQQQTARSPELALRSFSRAADDISMAMTIALQSTDRQNPSSAEILHATHDAMFSTIESNGGEDAMPALLDELLLAIKRGDRRWRVFDRLARTWSTLYKSQGGRQGRDIELRNLLHDRSSHVRRVFEELVTSGNGGGPFGKLYAPIKESLEEAAI
ncbi:putative DNA-binding protein [Trinickia symbiotica]|uniref:ATP-binding protein n=1 Tax=Trinickia symbiotica TaxID=863227 RepID=A0A2N7X907_9BURK|nr:RNA-binding domain-containing protein [Trinickia symbiotica]PMS38101.1 ATP-binding protein [Trinickia symbiotica]PPK47228.1 putative DNA-binding protein [Trinickia symbiotica]